MTCLGWPFVVEEEVSEVVVGGGGDDCLVWDWELEGDGRELKVDDRRPRCWASAMS